MVRAQVPAAPALMDMEGRLTNLDVYRGRVVLVNFWATWCAPCLKEMPDLNELSQTIDSRRAAVVGVAADDPAAVKAFVRQLAIGYPVVTGEPDQIFSWSSRLGNTQEALPFSMLLDADGKIRWTKSGGRVDLAEVAGLIRRLTAEQRL